MVEGPHHSNVPTCGTVKVTEGTFVLDADLLGEFLDVSPSRIPTLMREGRITSICERGIDDREGEFRLTFFHSNRRARLSTDLTVRILRRSVVDFGNRPIPNGLRRRGG